MMDPEESDLSSTPSPGTHRREMNRVYADRRRKKERQEETEAKKNFEAARATVQVYKKIVSILFNQLTNQHPKWVQHEKEWYRFTGSKVEGPIHVKVLLPEQYPELLEAIGNNSQNGLYIPRGSTSAGNLGMDAGQLTTQNNDATTSHTAMQDLPLSRSTSSGSVSQTDYYEHEKTKRFSPNLHLSQSLGANYDTEAIWNQSSLKQDGPGVVGEKKELPNAYYVSDEGTGSDESNDAMSLSSVSDNLVSAKKARLDDSLTQFSSDSINVKREENMQGNVTSERTTPNTRAKNLVLTIQNLPLASESLVSTTENLAPILLKGNQTPSGGNLHSTTEKQYVTLSTRRPTIENPFPDAIIPVTSFGSSLPTVGNLTQASGRPSPTMETPNRTSGISISSQLDSVSTSESLARIPPKNPISRKRSSGLEVRHTLENGPFLTRKASTSTSENGKDEDSFKVDDKTATDDNHDVNNGNNDKTNDRSVDEVDLKKIMAFLDRASKN